MEAKWIARTGSERLIIFFCGWGFDERCVSSMACGANDVVVLYDYRNLSLEPIRGGYQRVVIVAWSFGVWVAGKLMHDGVLTPHEAIAINGTLNPISDTEGIPVKIFEQTLATLTEVSFKKFNARICGGARQMAALEDLLPKRNFEDQLEELQLLGEYFTGSGMLDKRRWSKAIVATNDLIFPYINLKSHWGDRTETIEGNHLCFGDWRTWDSLLNSQQTSLGR